MGVVAGSRSSLLWRGALVAFALGVVPAASALDVTTTVDENGTNPAACALREAITALNTGMPFGGCAPLAGDTAIQLATGTYLLEIGSFGANGLTISTAMALHGLGPADTLVDLANVFDSSGLVITAGGEVLLEGLTLANLLATDVGHTIRYQPGASGSRLTLRDVVVRDNEGLNPPGLGFFSNVAADLSLERVVFARNLNNGISAILGGAIFCSTAVAGVNVSVLDGYFVDNETGDLEGSGGGILSRGCNLTLERVTFEDNLVDTDGVPGEGSPDGGGALASRTVAGVTQQLTLRNVTFVGNQSRFTGSGGAINLSDATSGAQHVLLENVTFADNQATNGRDILTLGFDAGGDSTLTVSNVLFGRAAGTGLSACFFATAPTSLGGNLDLDGSCLLTGTGDRTVADAGLAAILEDGGGFAPVLALLPLSPAVDGGVGTACPAEDERGEVRPQDGDGDGDAVCDTGAFELAPIFRDGFESGDASAWTLVVPGV